MSDKEIVFSIRKRAFEDWRYRCLTWQEIKAKYGFSKSWFYKFRARYIQHGDEGLRDLERKASTLPEELSWQERIEILNYVYDNPTHGPDRIRRETKSERCTKTIWNYLSKENLNSRRKRRLWAEAQGKPTLSEKEKQCMEARNRHVESSYPGELVSIDTFFVCVGGLGKIWQYTACDTYSSYGWARVYKDKTADNAVDFFTNHILRNCPEGKIRRVLTDQGVEFYSARHKDIDSYFTTALRWCGVDHTVTKKAHPWTNGYAERLNQTIWQEFYLCRLSRPFNSIEELQKELDKFMVEYNFKRMHSGYKLKAGGFRFPGHAFFDIRERDKMIEVRR